MIVEVGTSDFKTLAGKEEGLFIEPVKEYFDRLPECNKLNIAISSFTGNIKMFYIPSEIIESEGLPHWVRGCNSVKEPHPTIVSFGWEKYLVEKEVKVRRLHDVLNEQGIKYIDKLKIDTEGHDFVILSDFLQHSNIRPTVIQFEANELSDEKNTEILLADLSSKGYYCQKIKSDYVCRL